MVENPAGWYLCAACRTALFASTAEVARRGHALTFSEAAERTSIASEWDAEGVRIRCTTCRARLGRAVIDDPAAVRYCVETDALIFTPTR
jgi:peptide methionine sulfoxide reductase MsrB